MFKYIAIILYLVGAVQAGQLFHQKKIRHCHDNVYWTTIVVMTGWPLFGFITVQDFSDLCAKP